MLHILYNSILETVLWSRLTTQKTVNEMCFDCVSMSLSDADIAPAAAPQEAPPTGREAEAQKGGGVEVQTGDEATEPAALALNPALAGG